MTKWHGYVGFENLALDVGRRNALHQALTALGPESDAQPARILHWRLRLDNDAGIYEALFNTENVNLAAWKRRLAELFGVDPVTVDHEVQVVSFADGQTQGWTLSRGATDYLRVALFGDAWATWEESRRETLGYLALHRAEWEDEAEMQVDLELARELGRVDTVRAWSGESVRRVREWGAGLVARARAWWSEHV